MPRANSTLRHIPERAPVARLGVDVKPASKMPGIAVGGGDIVIRVRERAIEGAANAACIRALAERLQVAPSRIVLVRGARGRRKLFDVAGMTTEDALARLAR
jgi:uncharacterized protein